MPHKVRSLTLTKDDSRTLFSAIDLAIENLDSLKRTLHRAPGRGAKPVLKRVDVGIARLRELKRKVEDVRPKPKGDPSRMSPAD